MAFQDNPGQVFNEDFADNTGHTYNTDLAQFTAGRIEQIDQVSVNETFAAFYDTPGSATANRGGGTLTATLSGSPTPTIADGALKFSNVSGQHADYSADLNADSQNTITIRFVVTPQYSGNPSTDQIFFAICESSGDQSNLISIIHLSTGELKMEAYNQGNASYNTTLPSWAPVSGTAYLLELNCDFSAGQQRLFLDGTQHGITMTHIISRSANIALLRIGARANTIGTPNFWLNNIMVFSIVEHTEDYTANIGFEPTSLYSETSCAIPDFEYAGDGSIQSYAGFSAIDNHALYIINGKYYNSVSGAWETSNNNSQSNTKADVNTYISSLTPANVTTVKLILEGSDEEVNYCADLTVTYTGQIFAKIVPLTEIKAYLRISADDTDYDELLDNMIDHVSGLVNCYCNREFFADDFTEYYDGCGESVLYVANPPINSTESTIEVYDDLSRNYGINTQIDSTTIIVYPKEGKIALDGLSFMRGKRNIKVSYNGGYTSIPEEVRLTAKRMIAYLWKESERGTIGISSSSKGEGSITYLDPDVSCNHIMKALDKYVKYYKG